MRVNSKLTRVRIYERNVYTSSMSQSMRDARIHKKASASVFVYCCCLFTCFHPLECSHTFRYWRELTIRFVFTWKACRRNHLLPSLSRILSAPEIKSSIVLSFFSRLISRCLVLLHGKLAIVWHSHSTLTLSAALALSLSIMWWERCCDFLQQQTQHRRESLSQRFGWFFSLVCVLVRPCICECV